MFTNVKKTESKNYLWLIWNYLLCGFELTVNVVKISFILQEERKAATFAENIDKLEKDINSLKRLHDKGKEDSRWQFYVSMHFLNLTTSLE